MSEPTGKGSIVYKIIIVLLIVVVLTAILYPKKEWDMQAQEEQVCRLHMENIYYSTLQYLKKYRTFNSDLDSLIHFMEMDSMLVPPGAFEVERLTVWESQRDSFLIGFPDLYHYNELAWNYQSPETLTVNLVPLDRFKSVPFAKMSFYSDDSIFAQERGKGVKDIYVNVWGKSRIKYERVTGDSLWLPLPEFAITEDPADFRFCPSTGTPYQLTTNVKVKLSGIVNYQLSKNNEGNVAGNEFLMNIFLKKMKTDAAMEALRVLKSDTTIFVEQSNKAARMLLGEDVNLDSIPETADTTKIATVRDSLLNSLRESMLQNNFNALLKNMKPGSRLVLDEEASRIILADSVDAWKDSLRIKDQLFSVELDDKEKSMLAHEAIQKLFENLNATEKYTIAGLDTVGLTIACPIDSLYYNPNKTILQKIFGVGPEHNHGKIYNGDYSWEEKK